jgi:hypothetical protein
MGAAWGVSSVATCNDSHGMGFLLPTPTASAPRLSQCRNSSRGRGWLPVSATTLTPLIACHRRSKAVTRPQTDLPPPSGSAAVFVEGASRLSSPKGTEQFARTGSGFSISAHGGNGRGSFGKESRLICPTRIT